MRLFLAERGSRLRAFVLQAVWDASAAGFTPLLLILHELIVFESLLKEVKRFVSCSAAFKSSGVPGKGRLYLKRFYAAQNKTLFDLLEKRNFNSCTKVVIGTKISFFFRF